LPNKAQHIAKATNNESLSGQIDLSLPAAVDWVLTMLFYAALHYIEAYFSLTGRHCGNHGHRDSEIKRDSTLAAIFLDYCALKTYSHQARYQAKIFTPAAITNVLPHLKRIKMTVIPLL